MGDMKMTVKNKAGFLSMADRLSAIVSDEVEALGDKVEKDWLKLVKKNTPVGAKGDKPGELRDGWSSSHRTLGREGRLIELENPAEYTRPVEYGHRVVVNDKVVGYAKGRFFVNKSTRRILKQLPKEYKAMGARIQRRLGKK